MGQEDLEKQQKGAQRESPRTGPFAPEAEDIPVLPPLLDTHAWDSLQANKTKWHLYP